MLTIAAATKDFADGGGWLGRPRHSVRALDAVSFEIGAGESFGLVGESGSGKSTLARCIVGLEVLTGGRILFEGADIRAAGRAARLRLRSMIQIVFQDPYSSLDPRMRVLAIVAEPMLIHRRRLGRTAAARRERVAELLERVGLGPHFLHRFPHELSGGQRQRVAIARALAAEPRLLVLDEPTSALDVSVQAQVLDLLIGLRDGMSLTYLFVSHDLGAVRYACERVAVLRRGKVVEAGPVGAVFDAPQTDYTRELIAAVPDLDPDRSLAARHGPAA
jgi:ABC-type glutathione transport system ATPase component